MNKYDTNATRQYFRLVDDNVVSYIYICIYIYIMSRLNTYNSIHYKESKHICKASIVCIVPSKVMTLHVSDRGLDAGQKLEKTTKKSKKHKGMKFPIQPYHELIRICKTYSVSFRGQTLNYG